MSNIYLFRSGLIESKLRQIVAKLEVMEIITLVHPYIKSIDKVHYVTKEEKENAIRGVYPAERTFDLEEGSMETNFLEKIKEKNEISEEKLNELEPVYTTTFYIGLSIQQKSSNIIYIYIFIHIE